MPEDLKRAKDSFAEFATTETSDKWAQSIRRRSRLEARADDIRSPFARDYTRILHSQGYRRLKNKTQVFYAPENDHVCTRMEHVNHVDSVSYSIAHYLGLNTELTRAIAIGHDLGHAPFGHLGERILRELYKNELGETFFHERNGLHFVDNIELLHNTEDHLTNLDLTYAVRDGIISHCGEVHQNGLLPREEAICLEAEYLMPNQFAPFTWEGCVVKLSDKIAYLGRDIEDAVRLGLIRQQDTSDLLKEAQETFNASIKVVNTTNLINLFVCDLIRESSPERGLALSENAYNLMRTIMDFNYQCIYRHEKLMLYNEYAADVIKKLYSLLCPLWDGVNTRAALMAKAPLYQQVIPDFVKWLECYWDLPGRRAEYDQHTVYAISHSETAYKQAVLDWISGMSDAYAKRLHTSLFNFR